MKILVTGMTASQIHESTKRQGVTVAGAIAKALRDLGHEVTVSAFPVEALKDPESYVTDYDFAWIGQGPLKGLGTAYAYGALAAMDIFEKRCGVYCDDTGTRKIGSEYRSTMRRPADLVKPFWQYKKGWQTAREDDVFPRLIRQVELLAGEDETRSHPPVFMPAWTYDFGFTAAVQMSVPASLNLYTADPSAYMETRLERHPVSEDAQYWVSAWRPESSEVNSMGVRLWDIEPITRVSWDPLSAASGILIPSAMWAPELLIATGIGVPACVDWRVLGKHFGPSFEHLPANLEVLDKSERDDIANEQHRLLLKESTSKEAVRDTLAAAMSKGVA